MSPALAAFLSGACAATVWPMRRLVVLLIAGGLVAACSSVDGPDAVESRQGSSTTTDTSSDDTVTVDTDVTTADTSTDVTDATSATSTDVTTTESGPPDRSLTWGQCDPDDVSESTTQLPGVEPLECSTLEVPLDYDDPDGKKIELALIRQPASGDRQGAILTNPGGPGGSGLEFIANAASTISSELGTAERFDLVGFDPRGVDRSGGVDCVDDAFLDSHIYPDLTPDDDDERQVLDESEAGIYVACGEQYGPALVHYSTENTARDMDAIREALGDEQISFLGISYGTYLGGVYATLFPDRVRAMVLDSAFEPTNDTVEQQYATQLGGFEGAFDNWTEWCAEEPSCGFTAADADGISDRWMALFEELDENPLTGPDDRIVNQSTMFTATIAAMYSDISWPDLAASLLDAEAGTPDGILRMADGITGREPDGTYKNIAESGPVIRCASGIVQEAPDDPDELLAELREIAPRFSLDIRVEDLRNLCDEMFEDPAEAIVPSYDGEAPILVTGGTNDPATPLRWAEELDELMGPSSVLVQFNGEGHGQIIGSKCITELEAGVLADLEVPDEGTECDADPKIERPEWWDDLPSPKGISEAQSLPALLAAFGLSPSTGYGEVRLTELSTEDVLEAFDSELSADFEQVTETEIVPDVTARYYSAPDNLFFLVLVAPPSAFEGKDLESARGIVPDSKTAVVLVALDA